MYGYKIENGIIVVVEDEAAIIRSIFKNYLSGMSMRKAADATGVNFPHSTVKKIIRQKRYIGNEFYPAIIEKDVFARANGELLRRASKHCRGKRLKVSTSSGAVRATCTRKRPAIHGQSGRTFCRMPFWKRSIRSSETAENT